MIQFEHGKVLNILNKTTGEYEKFRSGDVVVEIGCGTKYKIVSVERVGKGAEVTVEHTVSGKKTVIKHLE